MKEVAQLPPLAARVRELRRGAARVFVAPAPVAQVVSFAGSFHTAPDFAAGEEVPQQLVVGLLDKGTASRDRFELAAALDDRGAQLAFTADGLRCSFDGRCLTEDLPEVLSIAGEMLREPAFDEEEFQKARSQQMAAVRRIMDDTGAQAHGVLARRLYSPAHPNYRPTAEDDLAWLNGLTVEDVRKYHAQHFGSRDAIVVFAGDVDPDVASRAIEESVGDWPEPTAAGPFETAAEPAMPGREDYPLEDRLNLDVRIGHPLALRRDDPDYLALYVAIYILGGNFSARLMSTVRDEQGLTYGISARLAGASVHHDAYFLTSVTLSQDRLDEGIEATLLQVRRFATDGITPEELAEKQMTLTGSFKVGMATSRGMAGALLANAERGFEVAYLDDYSRLISELTPEKVNAAIRNYIDPAALHVAVAGTLPEVKTQRA